MKKTNLLLVGIVLAIVFSSFIVPGPRGANDFPYSYQAHSQSLLSWPYAWSTSTNGLGQYDVPTLWSWPQNLLTGLLSHLGVSFSIFERLYGVLLVVILGFWGISKLFNRYKIVGWGRTIGTIFFLTNTYLLLLIDGGQLSIAVSYAVFPLALATIMDAVEGLSFKRVLLSILSVFLLSILDIRFIYILCILILVKFIFDMFTHQKRISVVASYTITGLAIGLSLLLLHAYWILPGVIAKSINLPAAYTRQSQVSSLSFATLGHSLLLQQPNWYKNIFGVTTPISGSFIIIPVLAFLAPILRKKNKDVAFWLIIALIGIFLTKGDQEPLGIIYSWAFSHIPGFDLFRDPSKFYFLTALSYSILIAVSIDELMMVKIRKLYLDKLIKIAPLLIIGYFLWLVRPTYLNEMTGLFAKPAFQNDYIQLANFLSSENDFSRIFWIPTLAPLGYSSPLHPSINASDLVQNRSFAIGVVGDYELFNFLREAPFTGELFNVLGIGYLAYPPLNPQRDIIKIDSNSPDVVKYYNQFLIQLNNINWIAGRIKGLSIPLLATKEHQPLVFNTPSLWWVIGSDSLYNDATQSANLSLSKNALIFEEQQPDMGSKLDLFPSANIVLNNKGLIDLAASFIPSSQLIFPATILNTSPNFTGWWKRDTTDLISWRNFLQTKYNLDNQDFDLGGGWAVAEGKLSLNIQNPNIKSGRILLARIMESSKSGQISFNQGDQIVGSLNTSLLNPPDVTTKLTGYGQIPDQYFHYSQSSFRWVEVGKLKNNLPITINTTGTINVVNALAVVNPADWSSDQSLAHRLDDQGRIKKFSDSLNTSTISFTVNKINPTLYKLEVKNLTAPSFLVFSQSYDPLWTIRYQTSSRSEHSVPVYSLVNGFMVDRNGEYTIYYPAQKYVNEGLIITGISLFALLLMLLLVYKNQIFSLYRKFHLRLMKL